MHKASANDWQVKKFECNTTMSVKISGKLLLKNIKKYGKKVKSLLIIKFDSKPVYGDNDKYIKTKIKLTVVVLLQIFRVNKCQKKKQHASVYQ